MTQLSSSIAHAITPDGTRIAYVLHGRPDAARRIVLVHSLAMDHTFWSSVVQALPGDDHAVVAVDARGHGRSDKPAGPYHVEQFADDVIAVMDGLGWEQAVVGGASMGGSVAISVAGRYPDRVTGLGLFDTTAWYGETAPADWEERGQKAVRDGLDSMMGFQQTRWFTDAFREAHPEVLARCRDVFVANDVQAYLETCRMLGRMDSRAVLDRITVPTVIMVGEEDYATPVAMATALSQAIRWSSMTVLPNARHLSPLEYPQDVAQALAGLSAGQA